MTREQIIKIAMVVCAVVLLCAVIITSTGLFGSSGIGGYANADRYTSGNTEIGEEIRNLDINWTSGKVTVAYHAEKTVLLQENAKRALSEDEKMQWWLDGDTLRVQFSKPGIRLNMPEKELILTLPEGTTLKEARVATTSGDVEIPSLKADEVTVDSTSGDINAAAETGKAEFRSTSGDMRIRLGGKAEKAVFHSTSGKMEIEADAAEEIRADSTSGGIGITAREARKTKAGSTSGSIYVTLHKMQQLELSATSGKITAVLPANPGFTAEVNTASGDFSSGAALTREGNRYACGDGSAKAVLSTTSGNIRIDTAESTGEEK